MFTDEFADEKRRVFLTQTLDDDDDAPFSVRAQLPRRSALLTASSKALQSTQLLQKQKQRESAQQDFLERRTGFERRMQAFSARRELVDERRDALKNHVEKFDPFMREKEARRQKAVIKYQTESRTRLSKEEELKMLLNEVDILSVKNERLKQRLIEHEKYDDFLERVADRVQSLNWDYVELGVNGVLSRYATLKETNVDLKKRLLLLSNLYEKTRRRREMLTEERLKRLASWSSRVSTYQKELGARERANVTLEERVLERERDLRQGRRLLGQICMAVENISQRCRRAGAPTGRGGEFEKQLSRIEKFIEEKSRLLALSAASTVHSSIRGEKKVRVNSAKPRKPDIRKVGFRRVQSARRHNDRLS
ncbi:coiled-coil domain-containing protein 42 homolog [Oscarella lobularis]|uniref:coiled-coil domain-containing protein 42 homolog n=1 Tax=Oscarella lobularis TaxID=121494 RepID=UPI0033136547